MKIKTILLITLPVLVFLTFLVLGIHLFNKNIIINDKVPQLNNDNYTAQRISAGIPDEYTLSSSDYDYDSPAIQKVIEDIKSRNYESTSQIIQAVGDYVFSNVAYRGNLEYSDCVSNNASSILNRGYGLCSTMSKLDITILRGLGISARPRVGCLNANNYQCIPLSLGTSQSIISGEIRKPKSGNIAVINGVAVTQGGLHTWVEVWIPKRGWEILEATTGYVVDDSCSSYLLFVQAPDSNQMCGLNYLFYKTKIDQCSLF